MGREAGSGPGTLRVGRFIGRLGVASLPAVGAGLDLDQRVVRRHVARLETAGWLERAPWVWGEGSVAWLTSLGVESTGLGGLRAVKAPPAPTTIAHGVLVGWSAARAEKRGRVWKSARELALDADRWEVTMWSERGYTKQLPDLAVWLNRSAPPIALISESGGRREDRQKKILEGWRNAVYAGQYSSVLYDCANESVARRIDRLAASVHLTRSEFGLIIQPRAEKIRTLTPAADDDVPPASNSDSDVPSSPELEVEPVGTPAPPARVAAMQAAEPPKRETPEEAAERERRYRKTSESLSPGHAVHGAGLARPLCGWRGSAGQSKSRPRCSSRNQSWAPDPIRGSTATVRCRMTPLCAGGL